ncbi:uncharacterized protein LOC131845906 [Achroia grisella]|uniref:uncharacterized protein LOC131845906 n=1 Tax=Achroia grisella TaxID=688607 RepID=UPI0027D29486|nr:uncharacterized protein LOC131845906 [Achroia grisella]
MDDKKNKTLQEIIDSDEEFGDNYYEVPEIPAYKLDCRFEPIQFPWLTKYKVNKLVKKLKVDTLLSGINEETFQEQTKNLKPGEKMLVTNAILSEDDIYCLKCIETVSSDATVLWLINFLMYKDIQSNFKYYKRCLVDKYNNNFMLNNILQDNSTKRFNFEFRVVNVQ